MSIYTATTEIVDNKITVTYHDPDAKFVLVSRRLLDLMVEYYNSHPEDDE